MPPSRATLRHTRSECDGSLGGCQSHRIKKTRQSHAAPPCPVRPHYLWGESSLTLLLSTDWLIHSLQWGWGRWLWSPRWSTSTKERKLVLSNPEDHSIQMYYQTVDVEVCCVEVTMSAEGKRSCYSVTRHRCVWAHSWNVAECRGELASETGGPLRPAALRWPTLWRWLPWCQHTC